MKRLWITRHTDGDYYNFHRKLTPPRYLIEMPGETNKEWLDVDHTVCARLFESVTGFKLKPGEGPVLVRIHVERCDAERRTP